MDASFPEGAISASTISKINEIHLSRVLEEEGSADLMPIIVPFSEGKILELSGQMKKAKKAFQDILRKNPKNRWAREALRQVERNIQ